MGSLGPVSIQRPSFTGMKISIIKIRQSWDRLIFIIMGITILLRRHASLYRDGPQVHGNKSLRGLAIGTISNTSKSGDRKFKHILYQPGIEKHINKNELAKQYDYQHANKKSCQVYKNWVILGFDIFRCHPFSSYRFWANLFSKWWFSLVLYCL